jgi:ER membrane protein SH3
VLCISIYLTVTIPALRTIVTPLEGVDTREDRIEAMRVLSAGNVMIMVGLGAILILQVCDDFPQKFACFHVPQAGQEYARRAEMKALARLEAEEKKITTPSEKKVQ